MKSKQETPQLYVLEHGIPIPPKRGGTGLTELVKSMSVGDSFVTDKAVSNIYIYAARLGFKFRSKQISETPRLYRVWRVA